MSTESAREPDRDDDEGNVPRVPKAVLEAIERLAEGKTASKEEIKDALKF